MGEESCHNYCLRRKSGTKSTNTTTTAEHVVCCASNQLRTASEIRPIRTSNQIHPLESQESHVIPVVFSLPESVNILSYMGSGVARVGRAYAGQVETRRSDAAILKAGDMIPKARFQPAHPRA